MQDNSIHIGTSGYSYGYWKGRFYPQGVPSRDYLSYYATRFDTVELNHTFYRFPRAGTLEKAAAAVPDHFRFSVKMNKSVTHTKRMKDTRDKILEFMDIIVPALGSKLGCILYQLPPSYAYSEAALEDILMNVPSGYNTVIEFRHITWWREEVYQALAERRLCFCSVSYPGLPERLIAHTNLFYLRLHGVPELFKSAYSEQQLQALAGQLPGAKEIYIYCNNTMFEAGYNNALYLRQLLE